MIIQTNYNSSSNNYLELQEEYVENVSLIHQSGGSLFSVFKLKLSPHSVHSEIHFHTTELDNIYVTAIMKGIQLFIDQLWRDDIVMKGFKIELTNNKFHPVDSKPIGHQLAMAQFLSNLFHSNLAFNKVIKRSGLKGERFQLNKTDDYIQLNNLQLDTIKSKFIPDRFDRKLEWKDRFRSERNYDEEQDITYHFTSGFRFNIRGNFIKVQAKKGDFPVSILVDYLHVIDNVIDDFVKEKISVKGMTITITPHYEVPENWQRFVDPAELQRFEWMVRNLLKFHF